MKLFEIAKHSEVWDALSEKEQIDFVREHKLNIRLITNPSENVQLAAVRHDMNSIQYIEYPSRNVQLYVIGRGARYVKQLNNPDTSLVKQALKDPNFIKLEIPWVSFVREYFANNTLLMKKWLRYGEVMREES